MKIGLLGVESAGKTSYFGGVYREYANTSSFPSLTPRRVRQLERAGAENVMKFCVDPKDTEQEKFLIDVSRRMGNIPMQYPESTENPNNYDLSINIGFRPVKRYEKSNDKEFRRDITIYDPPGEAYEGRGALSELVRKGLSSCDGLLVFLPSNIICEALLHVKGEDDDEGFDYACGKIRDELRLGRLRQILDEIIPHKSNDLLPICFVLSQFDEITEHLEFNDTLTSLFNEAVYDNVIMPFSTDYKNLIVCVTPVTVQSRAKISISDDEEPRSIFRAYNLEWPFLFALGGVIYRNSIREWERSSNYNDEADSYKRKEEALRSRSRIGRWWRGVRHNEYLSSYASSGETRRRWANEHAAKHSEDVMLAKEIWSKFAAEGENRLVRVYSEGELAPDPRELVNG